MNAAEQLMAGWLRMGVIALGGQVLVQRVPEPLYPGTPARKRLHVGRGHAGHRIRKARRLEEPETGWGEGYVSTKEVPDQPTSQPV